MHHRIVSVLRWLKNDPAQQLDRPEIVDACRQLKHTWRSCLLDPVALIHLFLNQILHGNTAITHLIRISGLDFTTSAYCQGRSRLALAVFRELLRRVAVRIKPVMDDSGTWHGHRVFVADGSSALSQLERFTLGWRRDETNPTRQRGNRCRDPRWRVGLV